MNWGAEDPERVVGALRWPPLWAALCRVNGRKAAVTNDGAALFQEEEAGLRLARNDRRSDTIYEKFRTRLVMGDVKAHKIVELVRQHGTEVNLVPSTSSGINGIATLELLFDLDGRGVWLGRTIRCIREAFGEDNMNPQTLSTSMLKAITWFLAQHVDSHEVVYEQFLERLSTHDEHDIRRKAVSPTPANGGAMWLNYYRSLVELWNFRRQEKNMIRWKTQGSVTSLGTAASSEIARTGWGDLHRTGR